MFGTVGLADILSHTVVMARLLAHEFGHLLQMIPQIACLIRCIVTLLALVWLFSTVCFQMCPTADIGSHTVVMPHLLAHFHTFTFTLSQFHFHFFKISGVTPLWCLVCWLTSLATYLAPTMMATELGENNLQCQLFLNGASIWFLLIGTRSTASTRTCQRSPVLGGSLSCLQLLVCY